MLDCYMALTVPYASKLARALEPLGLKWMEEFLPPDDYTGTKRSVTLKIPIHLITLYLPNKLHLAYV